MGWNALICHIVERAEIFVSEDFEFYCNKECIIFVKAGNKKTWCSSMTD